ncbi:MAG TPA: hypothetical protein ENI69_04185, partial [Rhodospirillales bacterium]|nr:hypothetical protein [Rhodospirillales bacterium]
MYSPEEFHDPSEGHGGSSIALFLGLYLLILAFFIMLVSISTLEEVKTKAAMKSLSATFTSILPPSLDLTAVSSTDGAVLAGQNFQQQITNMFSTTIQVSKVDVIQPGRLMRIRLKADVLFEADSAQVRPSVQPLMDRIVAAVSGRPPGQRFDMEFVVESTSATDIEQTLEMLRAGNFARDMLARGLPPDSLAVGLEPGDGGGVTIWFYVRSAD